MIILLLQNSARRPSTFGISCLGYVDEVVVLKGWWVVVFAVFSVLLFGGPFHAVAKAAATFPGPLSGHKELVGKTMRECVGKIGEHLGGWRGGRGKEKRG